jgi:hypothetical protein
MESIGALIQDLFKKGISSSQPEAGGYVAVVQVVKDCLKNAAEKIPACDRVTELDEVDEWATS